MPSPRLRPPAPRSGRGRTLVLAAAMALIGAAAAHAEAAFAPVDTDFRGDVRMAGTPAYPGTTVPLSIRRFTPGQELRLLLDGEPVTEEAVMTADEDGRVEARVVIPPEAAVGTYPVVVQASNPTAADIFPLKVSPRIDLFGAEDFDVVAVHADVAGSLYQGAYSAVSDALFITSSGRPPVTESALSKVDPETLEIIATATPPEDTASRSQKVAAVYGIAVDDATGTVWVTNSRSSSIAVYAQDDLSLIRQFPHDSADTAHAVAVDEGRHHAYVSEYGANHVAVFDTEELERIATIEIPSTRNGALFRAMNVTIDVKGDRFYVASPNTNEVAIITLADMAVERVVPLPGRPGGSHSETRAASSVAVVPGGDTLFVASQADDSVFVIDMTGDAPEVTHVVPVGAQALFVAWDPVSELAYVATRMADTIGVIDRDGELVANLDGGSYANHVFVDGKGHVFALNKTRGGDDPRGDFIRRISHRN